MSESRIRSDGVQSTAQSAPYETRGRRLRRPSVNLTGAERMGRMVIGLAAIAAGIALLASAGSTLAVVLEVLLVLAGVDLLVTGALGHCPLYHKLGYVPPSLRGEPR